MKEQGVRIKGPLVLKPWSTGWRRNPVITEWRIFPISMGVLVGLEKQVIHPTRDDIRGIPMSLLWPVL